ncbi:MAG: CRISPR-associated protein Cas4 [Microscillaceae bacterium]|nr:CRISPR-associated protein Cas4 [Microscillaceae bacterium]
MITATHINYYHICHRKLWLFDRGIQMEHNSEAVYEGKLVGEFSYPQRAERYTELALEGIKIDYYDPHKNIVHEIKKSDKQEPAHEAQVCYYLYVLEKHGILGASGILEYPRLRKTVNIPALNEEKRIEVRQWIAEIEQILQQELCPPKIKAKICKTCSYHDLCYAG